MQGCLADIGVVYLLELRTTFMPTEGELPWEPAECPVALSPLSEPLQLAELAYGGIRQGSLQELHATPLPPGRPVTGDGSKRQLPR